MKIWKDFCRIVKNKPTAPRDQNGAIRAYNFTSSVNNYSKSNSSAVVPFYDYSEARKRVKR